MFGVLRKLAVGAACTFATMWSYAAVINFEQFNDQTILSGQLSGLSFINATAISAGLSLNEFEFPPHSGSNGAFDDAGPMTVVFDNLQMSVAAYFTYSNQLTVNAFDEQDHLIATAVSLFGSNLSLSGDPGSVANEFISITAPGIKRVKFSGSALGGSFVLDDLTYEAVALEVPEPPTLHLALFAFAVYLVRRIKNKACASPTNPW